MAHADVDVFNLSEEEIIARVSITVVAAGDVVGDAAIELLMPSLALAVDVAVTVSIDDATDFHVPGPPNVQRGDFYRWK